MNTKLVNWYVFISWVNETLLAVKTVTKDHGQIYKLILYNFNKMGQFVFSASLLTVTMPK